MDEAIEWLKRCPNPHDEPCELEIRPVFSADDFGAEFTPELREQEASIRAKAIGLESPHFENGRAMTIAGLNETYTSETRNNIPKQWDRFAPQLGKVPGQVDKTAYGVCWNFQPNCGFDYLTGVEVANPTDLPANYRTVKLDSRRYIVFVHRGRISALPNTLEKIHKEWMPDCGLKLAKAPVFERYTERFDPQTGNGEVEIWVPLEA
jgi:predicted transcriptional regulator YdeE